MDGGVALAELDVVDKVVDVVLIGSPLLIDTMPPSVSSTMPRIS